MAEKSPKLHLERTMSQAPLVQPTSRAAVQTTDGAPIAAAYYPSWSAGSRSPESLDYSKFDILFFGAFPPFILLLLL